MIFLYNIWSAEQFPITDLGKPDSIKVRQKSMQGIYKTITKFQADFKDSKAILPQNTFYGFYNLYETQLTLESKKLFEASLRGNFDQLTIYAGLTFARSNILYQKSKDRLKYSQKRSALSSNEEKFLTSSVLAFFSVQLLLIKAGVISDVVENLYYKPDPGVALDHFLSINTHIHNYEELSLISTTNKLSSSASGFGFRHHRFSDHFVELVGALNCSLLHKTPTETAQTLDQSSIKTDFLKATTQPHELQKESANDEATNNAYDSSDSPIPNVSEVLADESLNDSEDNANTVTRPAATECNTNTQKHNSVACLERLKGHSKKQVSKNKKRIRQLAVDPALANLSDDEFERVLKQFESNL